MKKILPLFFLMTTLIYSSSEGKDKNPDDIIENIENKYEQLYASSPSVIARGKEVAKGVRFMQPEDNVVGDFSKLRQIALVRHGEPDMVLDGEFTSDEANNYLQCYDTVCIIVPESPFFQIGETEQIKAFSSPLNRALTTSHYIFGEDKDITISPIFREFENKISNSESGKKKSMKFWSMTNRVKWMLGGGKKKGIETFKQAKQRSKDAAQMLADASTTDPKVLLTAHGFLNRYIKKNLEKMGWEVVQDTGNEYFGTTILVKLEE
jgi:broad specificity phosphatase PhoE